MKAAFLERIERIVVKDVPTPGCDPKGLLLAVKACGVCGGDIRSYFHGIGVDSDNQILGHEIAGEVIEVGKQVVSSRFSIGDRLAIAADVRCGECYYCAKSLYNLCNNLKIIGKHITGGFAEYFSITPDIISNGIINEIPKEVLFTEATLSEPMSSCLAAQDRLAVSPGDSILIAGGGPIGCIHLEIAKIRGASKIILTEVSKARLSLLKERFDADLFLNPIEDDIEQEVERLTAGTGIDVIVIACPDKNVIGNLIELVKKRGRISLFAGLPLDDSKICLDGNKLHYREITIIGSFSYHPSYHRLALDLLTQGKINASKFISTYSLTEVESAIFDARAGRVLKAVLVPEKDKINNGGCLN